MSIFIITYKGAECSNYTTFYRIPSYISLFPHILPCQQGLQELACVGIRAIGDVFRCAGCDDAPAATTTFWAEIDDVIGAFDDVEVVLDDDHALAVIDEATEHLQQAGDVLGVQAGGWFVEDVKGFTGRTLGKLGGELDALRLTAGKRRGWLAEFDVAETDVLDGFRSYCRRLGCSRKNSTASSTVISRTSEIFLPRR